MTFVHWMALSLSALSAPRTRAPEVVWIDLANVPALAEEAARREAAAVLASVGLTPGWRVGHAEDVFGSDVLPVVLLPQDRSAGRGGPRRVLGACLPGKVGRVWVYLDNLAWTMGLPGHDGLRPEQAVRMGRAIGRIVAHEMIHAAAPGLDHARHGIMAASFGRSELLTNRLDVDAATIQALGQALSARRASSRPPTS